MLDMSSPTCSRAEKGAWHFVWSDFGLRSAEGWGWQFKGADHFLRAQRGGDGNSRVQIVFKGRRGVGMAIQGSRSFLKGAEGWG